MYSFSSSWYLGTLKCKGMYIRIHRQANCSGTVVSAASFRSAARAGPRRFCDFSCFTQVLYALHSALSGRGLLTVETVSVGERCGR